MAMVIVMDMDLDMDMDIQVGLDMDMDIQVGLDMDMDLDLVMVMIMDLDLVMVMIMDLDLEKHNGGSMESPWSPLPRFKAKQTEHGTAVVTTPMDQHKTGESDTETNMYRQQQFQWAEDDFTLPEGVGRLDLSAPIDGKKYVMYHGTTSTNAAAILANGFQQSSDGMLGPGVYLSRDLDKASRYPLDHPEHDRVVIKVSVNVGKVIAINKQGHPRQKTWQDSRYGPVYDTAWVPPNCGMVKSGLEEDCVWDPNRIKILRTIKPRPVQAGYGAHGYIDIETNMYRQQCQWAEDDFDLPEGVGRLDLSAPIDGKKYVMYHGTTSTSAAAIMHSGFRRSSGGMLGPGVYLSRDLKKASRYPIGHPENDRVVVVVLVSVGKVIRINYQGHPLQKTWHNSGYDTAWVPPKCGMVQSGSEEDCVWDPTRIKILRTNKPRLV
ncbi:grass carp reovirus (GCRV)-induced gene 2e [Scomber scombrus]|uniref:Grass carp reovirus (GCRV)-induced gene 2e n=1 Tax=Scomber scombrus TaxID=13677 RepID=A0AAV1QFG3_SCOSC